MVRMITGKGRKFQKGEKRMKNKMFSRMIAVLLAGCMILSTAGCGNNATVSNKETSESVKASETVESVATEKEEVEFSYPMDTDVKLSLWAWGEPLAAAYSSHEESPYHTGLAENTGVDIERIVPDISSGEEAAFNLMLTDEELPDMMISHAFNSTADIKMLMDEGIILDLTDLIPKYAPNYWAYLNEPGYENRLQSSMTDDGRLYGIQSFTEEYGTCYTGPIIRKDWLEECGLDIPVTLQDYEDTLKAFHEKYGATLAFRMSRFKGHGFASGTGSNAGLTMRYYVDDNGQIQCANLEPEWKAYLETLHRWYDEGLLNPDFATLDDKAVRSKIMNGECGITVTAMSQITAFISDAEASATGAEFVGAGYPRVSADAPTSIIFGGQTALGSYVLLNAKLTEEEVIAALRWCDYGFSEEGYMYKNFGTEGVTYTVDANGDIQFTELLTEDPDGMTQALLKYTGTSSDIIASIQSEKHVQLKNNKVAADAVYAWIENTKFFDTQLPRLDYTEEENIRRTDLQTPMDTYVQEMALKFITGEEDFAGYDAFIETVKEMGVQEVIDITQASYERYLNR